MSKSVIMFSSTLAGDIVFTGLISKANLDTMPAHELKLLTNPDASMTDRLIALACYFEEKAVDEDKDDTL